MARKPRIRRSPAGMYCCWLGSLAGYGCNIEEAYQDFKHRQRQREIMEIYARKVAQITDQRYWWQRA